MKLIDMMLLLALLLIMLAIGASLGLIMQDQYL